MEEGGRPARVEEEDLLPGLEGAVAHEGDEAGGAGAGVRGAACGGGFWGNRDDALVVGWAMVTRGELGFVMAKDSFQNGMLQEVPYVACVWALFVCTLVPPFVFGWALERKRRNGLGEAPPGGPAAPPDGAMAVRVTAV